MVDQYTLILNRQLKIDRSIRKDKIVSDQWWIEKRLFGERQALVITNIVRSAIGGK